MNIFGSKIASTGLGDEYISTKIDGDELHLQRYLLDLKKGDKLNVDHINRDTFNNKKNNLRLCTQSQNCMNQKISVNNKSGCKGVHLRKDTKMWSAEIMLNRKKISLGSFKTFELAMAARKEAEVRYHGEFAVK